MLKFSIVFLKSISQLFESSGQFIIDKWANLLFVYKAEAILAIPSSVISLLSFKIRLLKFGLVFKYDAKIPS